jgi:hypothetical protein
MIPAGNTGYTSAWYTDFFRITFDDGARITYYYYN